MLGQRLRESRVRQGLSQRELAGLCSFGEKQIWRYENGESQPGADRLLEMAEALNVSSDYLLGLSDDPSGKENLTPLEVTTIALMKRGKVEHLTMAIKILADEATRLSQNGE